MFIANDEISSRAWSSGSKQPSAGGVLLASSSNCKIMRIVRKRRNGYNEQEDDSVEFFGLVAGGILPGSTVSGEGLTGSA